MAEHPIIKKLQLKDQSNPVLIINAPEEYNEVKNAFEAEVHEDLQNDKYGFIQVFGTTMNELEVGAKQASRALIDDGLLWVCYPKKTSKKYKNSDCHRDKLAYILGEEGFEAVRQVAIDDDWSALRFRHVNEIKTMTRSKAATKEGNKKINK